MDPAFVEKGFRNWKKYLQAFTSYEESKYHHEYHVKLINDEETTNEILDKFSDIHIKKQRTGKYFSRFYKIFSF